MGAATQSLSLAQPDLDETLLHPLFSTVLVLSAARGRAGCRRLAPHRPTCSNTLLSACRACQTDGELKRSRPRPAPRALRGAACAAVRK
eukprot:5201056-Pleurochrysis_carterae.AAC.2